MDAGLLETEAPGPATTAERWSVATDLDQAACVFVNVRPRLVEIAYRILGSGSETDDVVQEAWLRWQRTDRSVVRNPTAFLATTTARLALNVAQSAGVGTRPTPSPGFWTRRTPPSAPSRELNEARRSNTQHCCC